MDELRKLQNILKSMHKISVFYTRILTIFSFFSFPIVYFFIYLRRAKKKNKEDVRIFLIPQLTRIGDIICSTPVLRAIKNEYPKSFLSVLVSANASGIIENDPRIDEIIIFEDYQKNFLKLVKKIQSGDFDWGISLSGTALSSLLFFYGLIPKRMKITRNERPIAEIFTDWMCNIKERYVDFSYLPAFYLKMLRHMGVIHNDEKKEVFFGNESKVNAFLEKESVLSEDKVVGMSITAGNKVKEWGDEKFEILAKEIGARYNAKIIFIGGSRDQERIAKLMEKLGNGKNYINAAGFALEYLPALMSRFSVFISVDTGPIHIADALGIPLIDILGSVNDIELTPRGEKVRIIKPSSDIPPAIFAFREAGSGELMKKALDSISTDMVLDAFYDLDKKYIKWS